MTESYSVVCICHNLFIHLLDCFSILAIVNNAAVNIHIHVFEYLFSISGAYT